MENMSKNLIPPTMKSLFPTPESITGLTGPQKCCIYAAWQLIKKDFQIHARNMFARFFEEFPEYLLYFGNDGTNVSMHEHSLAVFQSLGLLIERGFHDVNVYEQHLCYLAKVHPHIFGNDVKKIINVIIEYLLETLEKQRTNTLDTALIAFFDRIYHAFESNRQFDEEEHQANEKKENLDEKSVEEKP